MVGRSSNVKIISYILILARLQYVICGNSEDRHGVGNLSESTLKTLKIRFSHLSQEDSSAESGPLFPVNFEKWNSLRHLDGFICRNDGDCKWMTDTKFEGGFVELHCHKEDVDDSVKNKWFARPGLKLVGVSVGSCRCKHFLFPQYYNEDEVRCYLSIIIIISIVVFPFTLVMLAIACKIKNRVKSRVDVIIEMYNQAHVEQQPVAVKDNASRGRSSLN